MIGYKTNKGDTMAEPIDLEALEKWAKSKCDTPALTEAAKRLQRWTPSCKDVGIPAVARYFLVANPQTILELVTRLRIAESKLKPEK